MTDSADDLDALFEEMASQRQETTAPPASIIQSAPEAGATTSKPVGEPIAKLNAHNTDEDATKPMFYRLGNVVLTFHDTRRQLLYDSSLLHVAIQVVAVKDRRDYVATLTEQAAIKVL